jgi:hypothetical protein
MPAATPDTEPVATTHDANPGRSTGQRSRSWPVLPLALVGWFVGLLPWFVARRTVGTFGTPWNPRNDMREALLPFHHDRLTLLLSIALFAGGLAGLAACWVLPRRGRRLAALALAVLGAATAAVLSVGQTLSLHPDLGGTGTTAASPQAALVLLTVAGAVTGLALGLLVALGGPVMRIVAGAPLAVIAANWVGLLVTFTTADPSTPSRHELLPTVLWVLTGVLAGTCLALGPLPVRAGRAVGVALLWLVGLGLLWLTQSAFTAVGYFLEGVRGVATDAAEIRALARDVLRIFGDTLAPGFAPWRVALVALLVGVLGLLARAAVARRGTGTTPG